jgi:hypothetical protein
MKRLMFLMLAAIAFALGSGAAIAQQRHKAGSTFCYQNPESCNQGTAKQPAQTSMSPLAQNGDLYKRQSNIAPYVPADLAYVDRSNSGRFNCDDNGGKASSAPTGTCGDFVSLAQGSKWRMHFVSGGTVDRVFRVTKGGSVQQHVQFAGRANVHQVVSISPEAQQMAEANGYRFDQRSSTMVAMSSTPTAPAALNCKSPRNANEALACSKQHGAPTAVAQTPAPAQTAQADPCASLSGFLLTACRKTAAAVKGAEPAAATITK